MIGGMRNTAAAGVVAELLRASSTPLSLRELHEQVLSRLPRTAFSTTFRVVGRLEHEQLVHRVDWRERGSRFEWADRPHHHHLVCGECGHTVDIDDRDLGFDERRIESRTGFRVDHHSIELEGTCSDCR